MLPYNVQSKIQLYKQARLSSRQKWHNKQTSHNALDLGHNPSAMRSILDIGQQGLQRLRQAVQVLRIGYIQTGLQHVVTKGVIQHVRESVLVLQQDVDQGVGQLVDSQRLFNDVGTEFVER